ncbi:MAG TPA: hypothetical protein VNK95_01750 [Caldilineaceae bacterium]|nr:hypothetical protein [Caldilineaceae bacterium]
MAQPPPPITREQVQATVESILSQLRRDLLVLVATGESWQVEIHAPAGSRRVTIKPSYIRNHEVTQQP